MKLKRIIHDKLLNIQSPESRGKQSRAALDSRKIPRSLNLFSLQKKTVVFHWQNPWILDYSRTRIPKALTHKLKFFFLAFGKVVAAMGNFNGGGEVNRAKIILDKNTTGRMIIAKFVLKETDLHDKWFVITGGCSGIGLETAKTLASAGANVVVTTSRSIEEGTKSIVKEFSKKGKGGFIVTDLSKVKVMELDLRRLESVESFSKALTACVPHIDCLVLSAGVMALPVKQESVEGFEMHLAVNYIGHYYLTELLIPSMKARKAPSRIIQLTSIAHFIAGMDLDDTHYKKNPGTYQPWFAYGRSKLATLMHAKTLARLFAEDKEFQHISVFAVHPGVISTPLLKHLNYVRKFFFKTFISNKNISEGAGAVLHACLDPDLPPASGAYLVNCKESGSSQTSLDEVLQANLHEQTAVSLVDLRPVKLATVDVRKGLRFMKRSPPPTPTPPTPTSTTTDLNTFLLDIGI